MANPTKYTPGYSYSGWQASNPSKPLPAPQVDNDFANISQSVNQTIDALKDVRRSDGRLANGIVGPDALSPSLKIGFSFRGAWAEGVYYQAGDGVVYNEAFYSARVSHTSTAANTPVDTAVWLYLFSIEDIVVTGALAMPRNSFTGDGSTTDFTLTFSPASANNLMIALDGVLQDPIEYTINGTTVTFVTAPPAGVTIVVRGFATTTDLVTPVDGSVTSVKLADNAVTTTKVADAAITPAKLSSSTTALFATAAQGAKADTAVQKSQVPLNCTDYGVLPSLGDMSSAIASFLATCNTQLRPAYFPAGDYNCSSLVTLANARIPIFGDGQDVSRFIFNGSTKGLKLDNSGLTSVQRTVEVYGLGFLTNGAGVGTGFEYVGSSIEGGELRRSVSVRNCRLSGLTPSSGWQNVAKFTKALSAEFEQNYCSGAATVLGTTAATKFGVLYGGDTNIINVSKNVFDWIEIAAGTFDGGTTTEGLQFHENIVRANFWGIYSEAPGQWVEATENHFDVVKGAVKIGKASVSGEDFSSLQDNFVLRSSAATWGTSGSPNEFVPFDVKSNYVEISGNVGWLDGSVVGGVSRQANSIGVRVGDLTDSTKGQNCVITDNNFSGFGKDIHILSTAKNNSVKDNRGDAFGNTSGVGVQNDGDGTNIVENNLYVNSAGLVTVNNGAGKRWPYAEVFLTANITSATGDGTAVGFGGAVTQISNYGSALNIATMTYTALVSGVHSFTGTVGTTGATTSHVGVIRWVFSTNGDRDTYFYPYVGGGNCAFEQYMAAGETCFVLVSVSGGSKVVNILGTKKYTHFSARLVRPD